MATKGNTKTEGLSYDTKTLIVVLTLIFAYPAGVILMYLWMDWPGIVKLILAFPVVILFAVIVLWFLLIPIGVFKWSSSSDALKQNEAFNAAAQCMTKCNVNGTYDDKCVQSCSKQLPIR